jgi:3-hydroxyisobutyrate dehydrogenase-like beta-hydroxyacid dehydrogenase
MGIGFVGLGMMERPVVERLFAAGYTVHVLAPER